MPAAAEPPEGTPNNGLPRLPLAILVFRLYAGFVAVTVVTMILYGWGVLLPAYRSEVHALLGERAALTAERFADTLSDPAAARAVLQSVADTYGVHVVLTERAGATSSVVDVLPAGADDAAPRNDWVRGSAPVPGAPGRLLTVGLPWSRVRASVLVPSLVLVALMFALAVVGVGFARLFDMRLGSPLRRLAAAARAAAAGNTELPALPPRDDELGLVVDAVRRLHAEIRDRLTQEREERARLRAVLDAMSEGVLMVDPRSTIRMVNRAMLRMSGMEDDNFRRVLGKYSVELMPDRTLQEIIEAALGGEPRTSVELPPDPAGRTFLVNSVTLRDAGRVTGAVVVFHDITRLKALETQRRDFVSNASHELKTPLSAIQGYGETLLYGNVDAATQKRFLEVIHRNAVRLGNLVSDLLDLSRIESNAKPIDVSTVKLDEVIDRVLLTLAPRLKERRIEVERAGDGEAHLFQSDESLVEQVLVNLLDNGVKYNREGGALVVRTAFVPTPPPDAVPTAAAAAATVGLVPAADAGGGRLLRLVVLDSGAGIPPADQQRVFERFYRVDKARSRDAGGTGLGLAIVKHIVMRLGGRLGLCSSPGRGTAFVMDVPLTPPERPGPADEAAVVRILSGTPSDLAARAVPRAA